MDSQNTIIDRENVGGVPAGLGAQANEVLDSLLGAVSTSTASLRSRLDRLRAVVLLDGNVRTGGLAHFAGRSILDLPVDATATLLDLWSAQVRALAEMLGREALACRLLLGQGARPPVLRQGRSDLVVETDPSDLRGTGGVLRDATSMYAADDVVLVANAAQLVLDPLTELARQAQERGGEVTIVSNDDGSPVSFMLMTCRALRVLPEIGFVDLKEQGLPQMSAKHEVNVLARRQTGALPIRTARDYLDAVVAHHRQSNDQPLGPAAFAEHWSNGFAVIESGAAVAPDAIVHDSIILSGASVEAGAVVANSLLCQGAVVRRRQHVLRQVVTATGRKPVD